MSNTNRAKLFSTVRRIHEAGAAVLSSEDREIMEAETRKLLAEMGRKEAGKAPEGFEDLLEDLKKAENADEAYDLVVKFLDGRGELHEEHEKKETPKEEKEEHEPKPEMKDEKKPEMKDEKKPEMDKGPKGEGPKGPVAGPKGEGPKGPVAGPKGEGPKMDLDKDKKDLLSMAAKLDKASSPEFKEDIEKLKDLKKEEEDTMPNVLEMGIKNPTQASKLRVRVTRSRNILASYDGKLLFHAVPKNSVRKSPEALKRLANKVYGWILYEGVKEAARRCGTRLIGGVDDNIETVFEDVSIGPEKAPVTDKAEDVAEEKLETPKSDVRDSAEFVTKEVPDKVTAGVDDKVEVAFADKPDSTPSKVTEGEEDVVSEEKKTPSQDVRDDAAVDFKAAAADFKKLYSARSAKAIKEATEQFVERFIRSVKIAAKRMELNHDDHPFKAAFMDVLTATDLAFDDGERFAGLYAKDASELIELATNSGHGAFVDHLLARTAELMKKSDEYLADAESDLSNLKAKPVDTDKVSARMSRRAEVLRDKAVSGNFEGLNPTMGARVASSQANDKVRAAVGDTLLGRRNKALSSLR